MFYFFRIHTSSLKEYHFETVSFEYFCHLEIPVHSPMTDLLG